MRKHYRLSPSATQRWMECPGSLELSKGVERKETSYSLEGTKAHDVAEAALLSGSDAECEDEEMKSAVQEYLDVISNVRAESDVLLEHTEITLESREVPGLGGTSDHFMVIQDGDKLVLHVFDYKHGVGVPVDVEGNLQVLSYFAIIASNFPERFDEFRATIVQPRCFAGKPIQHWSCDPGRVKSHVEAILKPRDTSVTKAGSWCRWCPAILKCDTVHQHTLEIAQSEFSEYREDTEKLLELERITPAVKALLDKVPLALIEKFQDGSGGIDGLKCVERKSHRQWASSDPSTLLDLLKKEGIEEERAYAERKLKTPAQLEKELPDKKLIAPLITQRCVGYKIVPVTNKAKAVDFRCNEFTDMSDDEN